MNRTQAENTAKLRSNQLLQIIFIANAFKSIGSKQSKHSKRFQVNTAKSICAEPLCSEVYIGLLYLQLP